VVAEGLQDRAAEEILLEAGCDAAQGFLIGRPMDESEATMLLMEHAGLAEHADGESGEVGAAAEQGHPVDLETA
jgi:predicted signal transduction protein with EAL and GGDEF domain